VHINLIIAYQYFLMKIGNKKKLPIIWMFSFQVQSKKFSFDRSYTYKTSIRY